MITVVGIGADGYEGLTPLAQQVVAAAPVVIGAPRQLDLVPVPGLPWVRLDELFALVEAHPSCVVLASGDPSFFGVAAALRARGLAVRVIPSVSSVSLACARLGWALQDVRVVSLVGRAPSLGPLRDGERLLVLSADAEGPAQVDDLLAAQGFTGTTQVLSDLGGPGEHVGEPFSDLNVVAVEVRGSGRPVVPGLPDEEFDHDGQITKREVRAVVLALLAPLPGHRLWDVGAGTGSVGIEWARAGGVTVAVERDPDKCARVLRNAAALGAVVTVVEGSAPEALAALPAPDAVFVGGGLTVPGLLDACWDALPTGGRLAATAVTLESEAVLLAWQAKHGGSLTRLSVQRTAPVGGFTGWKPMTTVTLWSVTR